MKKAFTLIELVVAIAILAMVLSSAGVIFNVSIESHRTAIANAEIMRKLRAITDQLNADFKGVRTYPQGQISFDEVNDVRADCITFFANGDFQSIKQYWYKKSNGELALKTVVGNVASIFYGQLGEPDPHSGDPAVRKEKILARRQTILTSDSDLEESLGLNSTPREYCNTKSLSQLRAEQAADPNNEDMRSLIERPLDLDPDYVTYMAKGVDDFTIEYWDGAKLEWSRDGEPFEPTAFKFTFTLYDSRGVIKDGRPFTHIVYLGE